MQTQHDPATARDFASVNAAALRALGRREYSEFELRSKLERRFEGDVVAKVLEALVADHLLSDERFTEVFVRSRIARGQGPIRIRQELRQRGVADDLIDHFLTFDSAFWFEQAKDAAERRQDLQRQLRAEDRDERRRAEGRLGRFLATRGFPTDIVRQLLR